MPATAPADRRFRKVASTGSGGGKRRVRVGAITCPVLHTVSGPNVAPFQRTALAPGGRADGCARKAKTRRRDVLQGLVH